MTLPPKVADELFELVSVLHEQSPTVDQMERLNQILAGNQEAQRHYAELMLVGAGLQHWGDIQRRGEPQCLGSPESAELLRYLADQRSNNQGEAIKSDDEAPTASSGSPVLGFLSGAVSFISRPVVMAMLVVIVVIPFGLALLGVLSLPGWISRDTVVALEGAQAAARVTGLTEDCRWREGATAWEQESKLEAGEKILLDAGLARIEFGSGAVVLVEGPATFTVTSSVAGTLEKGKLTAQVPEKAKGFAVHTPLATTVDLGTEFGLVVDSNGATDVRVYQGAVRLSGASSHGELEGGLRTLEAGDALRVSYDATERRLAVGQASSDFQLVRNWPQRTRDLGVYAQAVLADRPLAYWPLDSLHEGDWIQDATGHGYRGQREGKSSPISVRDGDAGAQGAMQFDGKEFIELENRLESNYRDGLTVEAWARVTGGEGTYRGVISSRDIHSGSSRYEKCLGFTLYATNKGLWEFWTGGYEIGRNFEILKGPPVELGHWTYVVATFDPQDDLSGGGSVHGTTRLYVDGRMVATRDQAFVPNHKRPTRIGGSDHIPKEPTGHFFHGELSDVAVYSKPLEPHRIETHYQLGKQRSESRSK